MITSAKLKNHQTVSWHLNDLKTHCSQYMASLKNAFRNDTKSINFTVSNKQNTQKPKNNLGQPRSTRHTKHLTNIKYLKLIMLVELSS